MIITDKGVVNISIHEKYLGDAQTLDIISVLGKENLEEIQKVISDVTGLAFVTVDYKGEPVTEPTGFTRFCKKMRSDADREQLCKLSDASGTIIAATSRQTSIYFCPCGLLEVAIPIVVNGRYLGGFVGGQVKCFDSPQNIMRISKNISSAGKDLEEIDITDPQYAEDLQDATTYSYNEFVSVSKLVELIINQLTKHELISGHNKMENLSRIQELEKRVRELEYRNFALKSRYNEISGSTNMFFTRNIFNMLSNLSILEGAKKTNDAILKYASFITEELQEREEQKLRDELQRVKSFIEINQIRYEQRIRYEMDVEEKDLDHWIPCSLILPFVQAAIYYSMNESDEDYFLSVRICTEGEDIVIELLDNGVELVLGSLEKKYKIYGKNHEGIRILKTIKALMNYFDESFGNEYRVKFDQMEGKNSIKLRYPMKFGEGNPYV